MSELPLVGFRVKGSGFGVGGSGLRFEGVGLLQNKDIGVPHLQENAPP
jgi:hypothetical protein